MKYKREKILQFAQKPWKKPSFPENKQRKALTINVTSLVLIGKAFNGLKQKT